MRIHMLDVEVSRLLFVDTTIVLTDSISPEQGQPKKYYQVLDLK